MAVIPKVGTAIVAILPILLGVAEGARAVEAVHHGAGGCAPRLARPSHKPSPVPAIEHLVHQGTVESGPGGAVAVKRPVGQLVAALTVTAGSEDAIIDRGQIHQLVFAQLAVHPIGQALPALPACRVVLIVAVGARAAPGDETLDHVILAIYVTAVYVRDGRAAALS